MTAKKYASPKEVERVRASLEAALRAEEPGFSPEMALDASSMQLPESKRARALFDVYRLAWSAATRFTRKRVAAQAKVRGLGEAFFDDKKLNYTIANLERALTLTRNGTKALLRSVQDLERETARVFVSAIAPTKERHLDIEATRSAETALENALARLKTFKGVPQVRTQREWESFITESVAKLVAAGLSPREVAAILAGKAPDKLDRATVEKIRQRVRRAANSAR